MTEGEFESAIVGQMTDKLLTDMGHTTGVSEKRFVLFDALYEWRAKYHHVLAEDTDGEG